MALKTFIIIIKFNITTSLRNAVDVPAFYTSGGPYTDKLFI